MGWWVYSTWKLLLGTFWSDCSRQWSMQAVSRHLPSYILPSLSAGGSFAVWNPPVALKQRELHCYFQIVGGSLEWQTLARWAKSKLQFPFCFCFFFFGFFFICSGKKKTPSFFLLNVVFVEILLFKDLIRWCWILQEHFLITVQSAMFWKFLLCSVSDQ